MMMITGFTPLCSVVYYCNAVTFRSNKIILLFIIKNNFAIHQSEDPFTEQIRTPRCDHTG